MDFYGFYTGKIFDAYKWLGAHLDENGAVFRTFAPGARRVSLIGEFCGWDEIPMKKAYDGNFWECRVENAGEGMMYKYRIYRADGSCTDHCDPYGFGMELRPANASFLRELHGYPFHDQKWMQQRSVCRDKPLNIYEIHFGSFRKPSEEPDVWYDYEELAERIVPYLKENGYNYLEIMPLNEHPCDESWGYQGTCFFSPTSRYGTAKQLMAFVDICHQNDIGVILDFVPVHFAVDDYALASYDGTALYEYPNDAVGYSEWGSRNFMHSRGEVRSFLQSAAHYWLSEYHMDGIRMDAISRMIYWQGDPARGVNHIAVDFLKYMNRGLKERHPGILLAAEDSTCYPGITKPTEEGGIGFDYKWDMGWMNDTLNYFRTDPKDRVRDYHKLTFSMMYYYDECFLLPFSHDEVVHGKATILQKMNGDYDNKFPQARALYMYMYAHPGKKLNFMGNEIGQLREWDEKRGQDWDILQYPVHDAFHRFIKKLNHLYLSHPALYEKDYEREGFRWLDCNKEEQCIYAFLRAGKTEQIAAVFNFSDKIQDNYRFAAGDATELKLLLASDAEEYGGKGSAEKKSIRAEDGFFPLTLNPYSAYYFLAQATAKTK